MKIRAILLFGSPGAGKGTQGKFSAGYRTISTSPAANCSATCACRIRLASCSSTTPRTATSVPDEPTIKLWRDNIENRIRNGQFNPETDTVLLDGIPRNVNQAKLLEDRIYVAGILNLYCRDLDIMVERLQARALRGKPARRPTSRPSRPASRSTRPKPNRYSTTTARNSCTPSTPPSRRCSCCRTRLKSWPGSRRTFTVAKPIRVVYMGTADFACPSLATLDDSPLTEVLAVVTQPDRPRGRQLIPHPRPSRSRPSTATCRCTSQSVCGTILNS